MYLRFRPICLLCLECLTLSHYISGSYFLQQILYRIQYKTCGLYFAPESILSTRRLYEFCLSTVWTRIVLASFVTYDNFIVLIIELHFYTHLIIFCHSVIVGVFISTIVLYSIVLPVLVNIHVWPLVGSELSDIFLYSTKLSSSIMNMLKPFLVVFMGSSSPHSFE